MLKFVLKMHDNALPHLASVAVGVIGGYLITHHRQIKLSKSFVRMGWLIFTTLSLFIIFSEFTSNEYSRRFGNEWVIKVGGLEYRVMQYSSHSILFLTVVHVWQSRGYVTPIETLLYSGLFRSAWSVCIVWLIYMCAAGRAG